MHRVRLSGRGKAFSVMLAVLVEYAVPTLAAQPTGCAGQVEDVVETYGAVVEDGLPGTFKRKIELGSGRSHEVIDLGIIRRSNGFDGKIGWSQDVSGGVHDLNSDFARALSMSRAWLDAHQSCPPDENSNWTSLGPKSEGASTFDAWRVTPAGGAPIDLRYDRATHHLDRAFLQQAETRLIRHFADWRIVDHGHLVAFSERDDYVEDESEVVFRVAAAVIKSAAAQGDFARPADPHDAGIRNGRNIAEIPYADDHRTRIYVPVYLNDHGPSAFEIDNGGHFILDSETAKKVGRRLRPD